MPPKEVPMLAAFIVVLLLVLTLAACRESQVPTTGSVLVVKGRLTTEGVECIALRDANGTLYTLAGGSGSFRPGDEVCVRGRPAEVSSCMQGITIAVDSIGPASDCP